MCYGHQRSLSPGGGDDDDDAAGDLISRRNRRSQINDNASVVEDLRERLAETEARLERARAREAELSRRLEEMKRFVSVMEILESYLKRRFREQQEHVDRLFSSSPAAK